MDKSEYLLCILMIVVGKWAMHKAYLWGHSWMQTPQKAVEVAGPLSVTWWWRMCVENMLSFRTCNLLCQMGIHDQLARSGGYVLYYFKSGEKTYSSLIRKIMGLYQLVIIEAEMRSVY